VAAIIPSADICCDNFRRSDVPGSSLETLAAGRVAHSRPLLGGGPEPALSEAEGLAPCLWALTWVNHPEGLGVEQFSTLRDGMRGPVPD
jgi:hypothetical protein